MERSWFSAALLAAATASAMAVALPVCAQSMPQPSGIADEAGAGDMDPQDLPHPAGPDRPYPLRPDPLAFAARLSAGETYLGIAPDQLAAWRSYTTALIDLMDAGPGGMPGEAVPQADSLFGERLADDLLVVAEKAKALKDAAATLKPLLTPAQKTRLGAFERAMMPPPPFGIPAPFRAEAPPRPAAD